MTTPRPRPTGASTSPVGPDPDDLADLELSPEAMTTMGRAVLDRVVEHIATIGDLPAHGDVHAEALCRQLAEPRPPATGVPLDDVLAPYCDEWVGRSFTTPSPGYLAFIPGGGVFPSALADLLADGTNRYTGVWRAAPALVQLEANVLAWFAHWMGYPDEARGLLTSGGSLASLSAIVCAREKLLGPRLREGVLYTSTQTHHSVAKSARMAGILSDRLRAVPVDADFRMDVAALRDAIARDRAAGLAPFCVVSSAGTTNTGAVDDLDAITELCAAEGLWHHCDGAYGAFFHIVPELRPLLAGLSRCDSITLDPHKGLFLPYGTGALLVREGRDLRAAHAETAAYLPDPAVEEFYDPHQYGPELSRDFRGLRVWLPLKLFGAERFEAALREKRELALAAAERVAALPGVVLDAPPQLSLFAWHLTWPGATLADENAATKEMLDRVNAEKRVFLTGCTLSDGRYLARVCILCFRTRAEHVEAGVEDIETATREVLAARGV